MKKFQFSLETARSLRKRRVEAEEIELGKLQQELSAIHGRQAELEAEVGQAEQTLREATTHDAGALGELDRFRLAGGRRRLRLAAEARAMGMRILDQQKLLAECRRDLELLDKLKEKASQKWQHEYDKEQQGLAEEIFMSRWKN